MALFISCFWFRGDVKQECFTENETTQVCCAEWRYISLCQLNVHLLLLVVARLRVPFSSTQRIKENTERSGFGRLNAPCQRWRRLLSELLITPLIKILVDKKKLDNKGSDLITLVVQPLVPDTQETIKSLLTSLMAFRESGPVWFILLITHRLWVITDYSQWGKNMLMVWGNDAPDNLLRKKENNIIQYMLVNVDRDDLISLSSNHQMLLGIDSASSYQRFSSC